MKDVSIKDLMNSAEFSRVILKIKTVTEGQKDPDFLLKYAKYLKQIPDDNFKKEGFLVKRIAILGGYATQFLASFIQLLLFRKNIFVVTSESDYGLYEQTIAFAGPDLIKFKPDICYFCVGTDNVDFRNLDAEIQRWLGLWSATRKYLNCEIVQNTFEEPANRVFGNLEFKLPLSPTYFIRKLNFELAEKAPEYVHFNDINFLAGYFGRKNWRDDKLFDVAKVPVSYDHLLNYAENTASVICSIFGKTKKCLVLDLDNTLWGGFIGEEGISGIRIGEDTGEGKAYKRFQAYIKSLKDRGVILAICSKNDEENAKEPFIKRPEMVLKLQDISYFVANWQPKYLNIIKISEFLNISLDSMVIVDDSPAEIEFMRQNLEGVTLLQLPEDPSCYVSFLSECGFFETQNITKEDLQRTAHYKANLKRSHSKVGESNYSNFLKNLEMKALIVPFDEMHLPRVTQLINKTSQFNLTNKLYTVAEINNLKNNPEFITRYVKMKDRFGDNGLISALVGRRIAPKEISIDTWVMSCRVLKRRVENFMFAEILKTFIFMHIESLIGIYSPTKRNKVMENLFSELGFSYSGEDSDGRQKWIFDLLNESLVQRCLNQETYITSVDLNRY